MKKLIFLTYPYLIIAICFAIISCTKNNNTEEIPKKENSKKEEPKKFFVLVSAEWGGTRKHPKIVGKEVKIVEKLTEAQRNAKKYYMYGGSITEFSNMEEAQKYADQIER